MKVEFITGNQGKFEEMKRVRPDIEWVMRDLDLQEIQSMDSKEIIESKLRSAIAMVTDRVILVEDTSLAIDGLNGLPGPFIKWFYKTIGNEKLAKLAIDSGNASTTATVTVGVSNGKGDINYAEGSVSGKIVMPRGSNGFGWDPIFEIDGVGKTFAELDEAERLDRKSSMRRLALEKLNFFF